MTTTSMYSLIETAISELKERLHDDPSVWDDPSEAIFEIADDNVPVYNSDLLELALNCLDLAVDEPDNGPAFDGRPTACNIIAANVFEYIEQELNDFIRQNEDERPDFLDEDGNDKDEVADDEL